MPERAQYSGAIRGPFEPIRKGENVFELDPFVGVHATRIERRRNDLAGQPAREERVSRLEVRLLQLGRNRSDSLGTHSLDPFSAPLTVSAAEEMGAKLPVIRQRPAPVAQVAFTGVDRRFG